MKNSFIFLNKYGQYIVKYIQIDKTKFKRKREYPPKIESKVKVEENNNKFRWKIKIFKSWDEEKKERMTELSCKKGLSKNTYEEYFFDWDPCRIQNVRSTQD